MDAQEREERGKKGREWALSSEAQMSSANMSKNIMRCMELCFNNFTPRPKFDFIKVEDVPSNYIEHKLIY